jgi:hypothetical protein
MAFSHALASMIYLVLPLAPTLGIAAALLVIRSFFAYLYRQPAARFVYHGHGQLRRTRFGRRVTSLALVVPFGVSPTISTYLMQSVSLTLPLFIGGGLQLINDVTFYLMFRHVRSPEEIERS